MSKINIIGYKVGVPGHRLLRMALGVAFVLGGAVGFLPVLGFWMIPLGVILLSVDFHWARRMRRRFETWYGRRKHKRQVRLHKTTRKQD